MITKELVVNCAMLARVVINKRKVRLRQKSCLINLDLWQHLPRILDIDFSVTSRHRLVEQSVFFFYFAEHLVQQVKYKNFKQSQSAQIVQSKINFVYKHHHLYGSQM